LTTQVPFGCRCCHELCFDNNFHLHFGIKTPDICVVSHDNQERWPLVNNEKRKRKEGSDQRNLAFRARKSEGRNKERQDGGLRVNRL
jgi:hypothetical protein